MSKADVSITVEVLESISGDITVDDTGGGVASKKDLSTLSKGLQSGA